FVGFCRVFDGGTHRGTRPPRNGTGGLDVGRVRRGRNYQERERRLDVLPALSGGAVEEQESYYYQCDVHLSSSGNQNPDFAGCVPASATCNPMDPIPGSNIGSHYLAARYASLSAVMTSRGGPISPYTAQDGPMLPVLENKGWPPGP